MCSLGRLLTEQPMAIAQPRTHSAGHTPKWWYALACCMFALCVESVAAMAQPAEQREELERQVKAAYLYKFGSYVEWPERAFPAPEGTVRIGIMGASALADELAQVTAGRVINGRQVSVHKLKPGDSLTGVHILYIGGASNDKLGEILASVKGQPVLTVTESEQGLVQGGMINFMIVGGKLRFEVAPKTAQQGSLNISARLLAAAFRVGG
jgi:hypothetical protein